MATAGTEHDYTRLIRDNEGALVRLARHYASAQDWQDLLQEMHLQLWRSFGSWDGRAKQSTWVYRVALNTALSFRRKPTPAHQPLERAAERGDAGVPGDELALLGEFLATLDPVSRGVLLLDLEGVERDDVAEILGLSPNAIAVRMTRLRQAFEARFLEDA